MLNPQGAPPEAYEPTPQATPQPTAQQIAEQVHRGMWRNDRATQWLGCEVLQVGPGRALLRMTVAEHMLNGHAVCHGGLIAMLADSAFAYASNSGNELTLASGFAVELLAPARLGDVLSANCVELSRTGRIGVYDCEVHNQRGERVAMFRGRSYAVRGRPAVAD